MTTEEFSCRGQVPSKENCNLSTAAHKNKSKISGLLPSVVLPVQHRRVLLEGYLQLCAKVLGSSEQSSGNSDAPEGKTRREHFTRLGASTRSHVM